MSSGSELDRYQAHVDHYQAQNKSQSHCPAFAARLHGPTRHTPRKLGGMRTNLNPREMVCGGPTDESPLLAILAASKAWSADGNTASSRSHRQPAATSPTVLLIGVNSASRR